MVCFLIGLTGIRATEMYSFHDGSASGASYKIHTPATMILGGLFILARILIAQNLQSRLTRGIYSSFFFWLVPIKDLLQAAIWLCAFAGNTVEWRGQSYRLRRDGTLVKKG